MPRVAPIVRSKRYEHAIATLVAKRSEIAGQIKFKGADLAGQLVHIDAVLALLGYKGDPSQIVPLQRKQVRFRRGELWRLVLKFEAEGSKANKETARRIVAFKGWDASLVETVRAGVNASKVKRRREGTYSGQRQARGRRKLEQPVQGNRHGHDKGEGE